MDWLIIVFVFVLVLVDLQCSVDCGNRIGIGSCLGFEMESIQSISYRVDTVAIDIPPG